MIHFLIRNNNKNIFIRIPEPTICWSCMPEKEIAQYTSLYKKNKHS